jgi:two-component system KDP operon response regulator KdpE
MTPALTILIIDDEQPMRRLLRLCLEDVGWKVRECDAGQSGLLEVATTRPDAVLLDIGLPDLSGFDVLQRIREWSQVPVVMISVRDAADEKISALDLGADDYITKPFNPREVIARLRAVMRRSAEADAEPVFTRGDLRIDLSARLVTLQGEEVKLTSIEYALLRLLIKHAGKVVTQKQLLREVWGPQAEAQSHYLRVHFTHLRQKVDPLHTGLIKTEPGVGYRLTAETS